MVVNKRRNNQQGRRTILMVLAAACLSLTACLDGQRSSDMRYDAKTDEFHFVKLYYNIRGDKDSDVDYLKAMYANRDHILLYDVFPVLGEDAALRLKDGTYRKFGLGDKATEVPDPAKTPVDLAKIKIEPGKFFVSADKTLCYYHQYTIPGPVMDTLLTAAGEEVATSLSGMADTEVERRKTGKSLTWEEGRAKLLATIRGPKPGDAPATEPAATAPADNEPGPLSVLNAESLAILHDAVAKKALTFSRKGTDFTVTVKLSAADAKELRGTWDTVKKEIDARLIADMSPATKDLATAKKGMALLTVSDPKDGVLTVTADFVRLAAFFREVQDADGKFEPKDASKDADYARLVDGLKATGVAVDDKMKLEDVFPAFQKGTLPVDLPAKSVAPGEGMFGAAAGTLP